MSNLNFQATHEQSRDYVCTICGKGLVNSARLVTIFNLKIQKNSIVLFQKILFLHLLKILHFDREIRDCTFYFRSLTADSSTESNFCEKVKRNGDPRRGTPTTKCRPHNERSFRLHKERRLT